MSQSAFDNWTLLSTVDAEFRLQCSKLNMDYRVASSRERVRLLAKILSTIDEWPESWQEIATAIRTDDLLNARILLKARRSARNESTVESVLQTVPSQLILICIRNAGNWHTNGDTSRNWRGFVLRHVNKLVARAVMDEEPAQTPWIGDVVGWEPLPEDVLLRKEAVGILENALLELSPQVRRLVELCCIESISLAEAARQLDLKYSTAADRLNRALDELRSKLRAAGWGDPFTPH